MEEYFKEIVDVNFTAGMEDKLDDVEIKDLEWKKIIRDFYGPFEKELEVADHAIEKVTVEDQPTGETCELCGKPMVLKTGRFGGIYRLLRISGVQEYETNCKTIDVKCPKCGKDIVAAKAKKGNYSMAAAAILIVINLIGINRSTKMPKMWGTFNREKKQRQAILPAQC